MFSGKKFRRRTMRAGAARALETGFRAVAEPLEGRIFLSDTQQFLVGDDPGPDQFGSITGVVFKDDNGNLVEDADEHGLGGRTVYSDANDNGQLDAGEMSAVTQLGGAYRIDGLLPGTYKLREVVPELWRATLGADGITVNVTSGQTAGGNDFGAARKPLTSVAYQDFHGTPFVEYGGATYFLNGPQLWKTDGTAAGTGLIKQFAVSGSGSAAMVAGPDGFYFWAVPEGEQIARIWKSDGTVEGTHAVNVNVWGRFLGVIDGSLILTGYLNFSYAPVLLKTDGTEAGTQIVAGLPMINPMNGQGPAPTHSLTGDGIIYFDHSPSSLAQLNAQVYRTDGTTAGTFQIGYDSSPFVQLDGHVYFAGYDDRLLQTDGTVAGTVPVTGMPDRVLGKYSTNYWMWLQNEGAPNDWWILDGSRGGAVHWDGPTYSQLQVIARMGDRLLYLPRAFGSGTQPADGIWRSDGTVEGTAKLDFAPEVVSILAGLGDFNQAAYDGKRYYFVASDGVHGAELWSTDGTVEGTGMVKDIVPGPDGSNPTDLTCIGNTLYFHVGGPLAPSLWKSDGTEAGTVKVADLTPTAGLITGRVVSDLNGNGIADASEPGIYNAVYLDLDGDGIYDQGADRAVYTDSAGNYSFQVSPGSYQVRCMGISEHPQLTVSVAAGQISAGNDFAVVPVPGSVSGRVFNDLNGNGIADAGEPGIFGWAVYIDSNNNGKRDQGEPGASGNSSGAYRIYGVIPGTRIVRLDNAAGWTVTLGADGLSVTVIAGQTVTEQDFGVVVPPSSITGRVFNDLNGNGIADAGEPGIAGWQVYIDADDNGQLGAGERSAMTDAGGAYRIDNLFAGSYKLRQVVPGGWAATLGAGGRTVTVFSAQESGGNDFGAMQLGSIAGRVFNDLNGNGISDAEEPGIAGRQVYIDANGNGQLDGGEISATTDASGAYRIDDVLPGTGTVRQVVPAGWAATLGASGLMVTVVAGQTVAGQDFGDVQVPGSIAGRVFNDLNGNGIADAGEPGIAGWTVYIDANDNGRLDAGEVSATTDGAGTYLIGGILPGTSKMREAVRDRWAATLGAEGTAVVVSSDQVAGGNDFGAVQLASVTGTVFNDVDRNGIRDSGEGGVSGQTVYIDANGNGQFDAGEISATSDAAGAYRFGKLIPGSYTIRVSLEGWKATSPDSIAVNLVGGDIVSGKDFGVAPPPGSTTGQVFSDLNGNGVIDANEPGIAGRPVYVDANNNGLPDPGEENATTDANGQYSFDWLTLGTYVVRLVPADGWQTTAGGNGLTIMLATGQESVGNDFGSMQLASIRGIVFQDLNGDGQKNLNDSWLAGTTLFLDANGNGELDAGERSTTTDSAGQYRFDNVAPGAVRVCAIAPAGLKMMPAWQIVNLTSGKDAVVGAFAAASALGAPKGAISGAVFYDANRNGRQDRREKGLAGWRVFIDADSDGVLDKREVCVLTDKRGLFAFKNLPIGKHTLRVSRPKGSKLTAKSAIKLVRLYSDKPSQIVRFAVRA